MMVFGPMNRLRSISFTFLTGILAMALVLAVPATAQDTGDIRTADYDVQQLEFPDLRSFEVPSPERVELDNGMTIFLLEDHELPQVQATARIAGGSVYEPAEKVGLASVMGSVMRTGGTATMPSDSVNRVLENVGATVETGMGSTSGSAFMRTLREHVDTVLPVFAEVLRTPAFAEEKVALAKNQQKSVISRRNDNAQQIASREFDKVLYGADSPYARTPEYYTIDRITREDVVDFHEQYVQPGNIILSVWGDFDAEAMEEKLRAQFADWQNDEGFAPPTPPEREGTREYSVNFVQKDDVNQSTIFLGHPGELERDDADYPAVIVMNEVLSGGFSGRLFQNVRKDQGLAYSVFGNYSAGYDRPGRFTAGVFTKSGTTVEAAESVMREVEKMREGAPASDELELAKDSYLNSFVFNFDTKREVLSRLMTYEYYDYPSDFLQQTKNAIGAVSAEDVLRVSETYLHPEQSTVLIVGRQQDFSEDLSALTRDGSVNEIDITIPTSPPDAGDTPAASAEDRAAGMEKLRAAKEALGGSAIDEVNNMKIANETNVQSPMGQATITGTSIVTMDGKAHIEQTLPNGMTITIVDDGEDMTLQTPQGTQPVPAQRRAQINSQLWRDVVFLTANLDRDGLQVESLGTETIEGTSYDAVRVTPPEGEAFTLYLDPETMQPARISYTAMTQQGPQDATDVLSDYQRVSGVLVPHQTTTYHGDQERSATTVTSATINASLDSGTFLLNTE